MKETTIAIFSLEFSEHERGTLARELLFTLYLYSGLRPSVWGKVISDN